MRGHEHRHSLRNGQLLCAGHAYHLHLVDPLLGSPILGPMGESATVLAMKHLRISCLFLLACREPFYGMESSGGTGESGESESSTGATGINDFHESSESESTESESESDSESGCENCGACDPDSLYDLCDPFTGCPGDLECAMVGSSLAECKNFVGTGSGETLSPCQAVFNNEETSCRSGNVCVTLINFADGDCASNDNCCAKLCWEDEDCEEPYWCHNIYTTLPSCLMWPGNAGGFCGI